MSDPRDVETALDAKAGPPAEAIDDGGGDAGSSSQVVEEAQDADLRQAPGWLTAAVAQTAGDAGSLSGSDGPVLDPSSTAGLDARVDASAAFEDWRARGGAPEFGLTGGLGDRPDVGATLDGLRDGFSDGSAFHSSDLAGLDRSLDASSRFDPAASRAADLQKAAQAGLGDDRGPQFGESGGIDPRISGIKDDPPSAGTPDGGTPTADPPTTPWLPDWPSGAPSGAAGPSQKSPSNDPPADPPDDDDSGTGEDVPTSARTKAALDFLGVPPPPLLRPDGAPLDFGRGDPGGDGADDGGDPVGGSGTPVHDADDPYPNTIDGVTVGYENLKASGPIDRPLRAGPDYGSGDPGGNGLNGGGPVTVGRGTAMGIEGEGDAGAGGAPAPAGPPAVTGLGGTGGVGSIGVVGATGEGSGTTGGGAGGTDGPPIASSSSAMTADTNTGTDQADSGNDAKPVDYGAVDRDPATTGGTTRGGDAQVLFDSAPVAAQDSDGDGVSDLQERLEGTDPNDASDRPQPAVLAVDPSLGGNDPRGDLRQITLGGHVPVDLTGPNPGGFSVEQTLPTGLDGKPINMGADHDGIGDEKLLDGRIDTNPFANLSRDPTAGSSPAAPGSGRDPQKETLGRDPGPAVAGSETKISGGAHTAPPPGEELSFRAPNSDLVSDDNLRALVGVGPQGGTTTAPKTEPGAKLRESQTPAPLPPLKEYVEPKPKTMTDPDAGGGTGTSGTPTAEELAHAVAVRGGATDLVEGYGGRPQIEEDAPPKPAGDLVTDPIEQKSTVNVSTPSIAPPGGEISYTINPDAGFDPGRSPSSGPGTGGGGDTAPRVGTSSAATAADALSAGTGDISVVDRSSSGRGIQSVAVPVASPAAAVGRLDPSTISGSEDDDLEDLEVQRRTVRGGDPEAPMVSATGVADDSVRPAPVGDPTVSVVGVADDSVRPAPAGDFGPPVVPDADTIGGRNDPSLGPNLADIGPATADIPTVAAVGVADDSVRPATAGPSAVPDPDTIGGRNDPSLGPNLADDFNASIMGGLETPVEVSATGEVPAASLDLAVPAPAVAEQDAAPIETAPIETAPIETDFQDLPVDSVVVEIAPVAFEAAEMDQPALEQVDPRPAWDESGPDASGMEPGGDPGPGWPPS
jgi:hypothetical protein